MPRLLLVLLLCLPALARRELSSTHGPLDLDCSTCHSTSGWTQKAETTFDHGRDAGWPLEGVHQVVDCATCHVDLRFRGTGSTCADCHLDPHQGGLGSECRDCHGPERWLDRARQERRHERSLFPLTGAHRLLSCTACHEGTDAASYTGAPLSCAGCHTGDYLRTSAPDHDAGGLGTGCADCHTTTRWADPGGFSHDAFPLRGRHADSQVACAQCHEGSNWTAAPTACGDCHGGDWEAAANPSHAAAAFSRACASCHDEWGWRPSSYDHQESTGYSLEGGHGGLSCLQCHAGETYQGTTRECFGCHAADYQAAVAPPHQPAGYPTDCTLCHEPTAWEDADFDHQATAFPLLQSHAAVACADCHLGGNFSTTPTDCHSCHRADYEGTTEPPHLSGLFPEDCTLCHDAGDWRLPTLDHQATAFPLRGAHLAVACADCHTGGQYADNPTDCWGCHESDYAQSDTPPHQDGLFPQDCVICHGEDAWVPATLDHDLTAFPLTGAHVAVSCADCHVGGQFADLPGACWNCHEPDYQQAADPGHGANLFPQDCTVCHGTDAWRPSTFDHQLTAFPLTGAHVGTSCVSCHAGGQYVDLPGACWNCHEPDYQQAADPDHAALQFPQDCALCHTTAQWEGAAYDHDLTDFPLTGAHAELSCVQCHEGGQYAGTPTDCWSCHEDDFQSAQNPDHVAAQFPHDCILCHTTAQWEGAAYDHDLTDFPLTGAHTAVACVQCHANGQYENTPTDCYFCHDADYTGAGSPDHDGEGYPTDCAMCHTTQAGWSSAWNHAGYFPIYTGRHRDEWQTCATCHLGGDLMDFSCTHCHEHRQSAMDEEHSDVNGYVWESHHCLDCHPDGSELAAPSIRWKSMDLRPRRALR